MEKIYGLMITGKDEFHLGLAKSSATSFLNQTYPNKHLVIINDGDYNVKEQFNDKQKKIISEIKLPNKKFNLGRLRNISLEFVPDDALFVQWDDDDWHHHQAVQYQYEHLVKTKSDVVCFQQQTRYFFDRNHAHYFVSKGAIEGTIMARKKDIIYPEMSKGEDSPFYNDYEKRYKVSVMFNNPILYIRFIHGHNTWERDHFNIEDDRIYTPNDWFFHGDEYSFNYLKEALETHYNIIVPIITKSKE